MTAETELDPVIHAPARLRLMVTLATLRDGDNLSFTRLQELLGLTPGNLITHLRKLEDAGYVVTVKRASHVPRRTSCGRVRSGTGQPRAVFLLGYHRVEIAAQVGPYRGIESDDLDGALKLAPPGLQFICGERVEWMFRRIHCYWIGGRHRRLS